MPKRITLTMPTMQTPPDWFMEPLIALATSIREHASARPLPILRVSAELGLALGIPAGQTIRVHTPAGPVDIAADHVNSLPGDPHPGCDGCEALQRKLREAQEEIEERDQLALERSERD